AEFDMKRSGAGMAWDYFHPGVERPWLFNYLEDRDLWLHKLPHTHEINLALSAYEFNFQIWDQLTDQAALQKEGELLTRYRGSIIHDVLRGTHFKTLFGYENIPCV